MAEAPRTRAAVAIVIPVFNKRHCVELGVGSVLAATRADPQVELCVVDNGSTDGTLQWLEGAVPSGCLFNSDARTISGVRNFGASRTSAPLLAFLDSDVLVPPDFVQRLRDAFLDQSLDATGCECGLPPDPGWVEAAWYRLTVRRGDGPRRYINSANFAVRRQAFEAVGGFPEDLQTAEDYELCRRLVVSGYSLRQESRLEVAHLDNPKSLWQFLRKTYWHGLGAVRAADSGRINLPTLAALAHVAMVALAAALFGLGVASARGWPAWAALAAFWAVPVALYGYRSLLARRLRDPCRSLLLCQAFVLARGAALIRVVFRPNETARPARG